MAKKIQAWAAYASKITLGNPMTKDELIENIIAATNQSGRPARLGYRRSIGRDANRRGQSNARFRFI